MYGQRPTTIADYRAPARNKLEFPPTGDHSGGGAVRQLTLRKVHAFGRVKAQWLMA